MAEVTTSRVLPPEFVEAAGKTYLSNLADATGQLRQLIYQKELANNL